MIISISGRKNVGKDLVAKIIQYLTAKEPFNCTLERFITSENWLSNNQNCTWEIKKFAGKLKQIASLLTGVPIEKWEDPLFKKTYMGEEWNKWCVEYSTMSGNYKEYFNSKSRAQNFKTDLYSDESVYSITQEIKYIPITHRQFLQWLGTEGLRNGLHKNVWVNALMSEYIPTITRREILQKSAGFLDCEPVYPSWVISDTRFYNELQTVKDRGGICIRIDRGLENDTDNHPSEKEWRNWEFDYVLENNADIPTLVDNVEKMLKYFKLI